MMYEHVFRRRRVLTRGMALQSDSSPPEIALGRLAPLKVAVMPAFAGILAYIGPGIVWAGLAQGSGELIWWPYLTAKYGDAFLGLLIPASLMQLWVNIEIARYTIVTGETAMTGFSRIGRWYAALIWCGVFIENIWFGAYASAGGTALAELTGLPSGWTPPRPVALLGVCDDRRVPLCAPGRAGGLPDRRAVDNGGRRDDHWWDCFCAFSTLRPQGDR